MSTIDMDDIDDLLAEDDSDLFEPEPETVEPEPVFLETDEDDEPVKPERQQGQPRRPQMSGHCAFPQTAHPEESHERCARNGAGNRAVPANKQGVKEFAPCPCRCHLGETYECGNCGRTIRETDLWTGDGEVTYVHVDRDGNAIGEEC